MQLCFLPPPTATDNDDFLDFSHDDLFFYPQFRSLICNDDYRALHDLSADSTVRSLLLCDTACSHLYHVVFISTCTVFFLFMFIFIVVLHTLSISTVYMYVCYV